MNEKIEPSEEMVKSAHAAALGRSMGDPKTYRLILRTALNHPDAAGLFVDEDSLRDAREQGWDEAAEWGYRTANLGHQDSNRIKDANPHRPVQELPTKDGSVIVHLEHEAIRAKDNTGHLNDFHRLTLDEDTQTWYGMDLAGNLRWTTADDITPNTWKVEEK